MGPHSTGHLLILQCTPRFYVEHDALTILQQIFAVIEWIAAITVNEIAQPNHLRPLKQFHQELRV